MVSACYAVNACKCVVASVTSLTMDKSNGHHPLVTKFMKAVLISDLIYHVMHQHEIWMDMLLGDVKNLIEMLYQCNSLTGYMYSIGTLLRSKIANPAESGCQ